MRKTDTAFLDENLSVYLDIVRFAAAISVVLSHMDLDGLYASWVPVASLSHESVIYFFVLSGLVVCNAVIRRESDFASYLTARVSRIYSVVIPAVLLSYLVKGVAGYIDGGNILHDFLENDLRWINVVGSLLFINESWSMPSELPWNSPYWSLCYEVWFYVIFGMAMFLEGRPRWLAVCVCAFIAGPSIMIMFPIWLSGMWLAKNGCSLVPRAPLALPLWILSFTAIWLISDYELDITVKSYLHDNVPGYWRLESAQRFPTDYVIGVLVIVNIVSFRGISGYISSIMQALKPVSTFIAGFTFSIYLYHRPMTSAIGLFFPNREQKCAITLMYFVAVVALCMILGTVTERRRQIIARLMQRWLGRY